MAIEGIPPLPQGMPIVDPNTGAPSREFAQWWQQMFGNTETLDEEVEGKADATTEIIAGTGLTGGGTLSADRTLNVGAGTGITVNPDDVAIDTTAEAERIRDVIGAALVAGANITITVDDGADTITIAASGGGGGGGTAWTLVDEWVHSVDGNIASFEVDVAGYSEAMVVVDDVTAASSSIRRTRVSTDSGASFFSSSGDYVEVPSTGAVSNRDSASRISASSTAARSLVTRFLNLEGAVKSISTSGLWSFSYFVGDTDPITDIQVSSDGNNMTGGAIHVYAR